MKEPHKIPHLQPDQITTIQRGNQQIRAMFLEKQGLEELTYAVIAYYPEEDLEVLTELAGNTYRPFEAWIQKFAENET